MFKWFDHRKSTVMQHSWNKNIVTVKYASFIFLVWIFSESKLDKERKIKLHYWLYMTPNSFHTAENIIFNPHIRLQVKLEIIIDNFYFKCCFSLINQAYDVWLISADEHVSIHMLGESVAVCVNMRSYFQSI